MKQSAFFQSEVVELVLELSCLRSTGQQIEGEKNITDLVDAQDLKFSWLDLQLYGL